MPRRLHLAALLVLLPLAACPAEGPATSPPAPARRTVTPEPTGAPSFGTAAPKSLDIARIQAVSPWVGLEDGELAMTFLFQTAPGGELVYFTAKPPVRVAYAFSDDEAAAPWARGTVSMGEDSLKFPLAGQDVETLGARVFCRFSAVLPDNRELSGARWVEVERAR